MNELEQELLKRALESIQAKPPGSAQPLQHILDPIDQDAQTKRALESLRHQGFLTGLTREQGTNTVFWSWQWDAEKVLAWGKSQEPCYHLIPWAESDWKQCFTGSESWQLETPFGIYSVSLWGGTQWTWSFDGFASRLNNKCESLESGKAACWEDWKATLIDGGIIEEAKNGAR